MSDTGFFSRWSQRKAQVRGGVQPAEPAPAPPPAPAPITPPPAAGPAVPPRAAPLTVPTPAEAAAPATAPAPPPPTLDDAAALTPDADFSRFVAPDVEPAVRNTALKKLFADPHFNVMDGLDTYIDDYGRPDPLPAGMLRQMAQAQFLGLFHDEQAPPAPASPTASAAEPASPAPTCPAPPDEDPDLRLQPDDAAGCAGPGPRPDGDAGRQP